MKYTFKVPLEVDLDVLYVKAPLKLNTSTINGEKLPNIHTDWVYYDANTDTWFFIAHINVGTGQLHNPLKAVKLNLEIDGEIELTIHGTATKSRYTNHKFYRTETRTIVPLFLQPLKTESSWVISMEVDENGFIYNWNFDVDMFTTQAERELNRNLKNN